MPTSHLTLRPRVALLALSLVLLAHVVGVCSHGDGGRYLRQRERKGVLLQHAGIDVSVWAGRAETADLLLSSSCPHLCTCQRLKVYCDGMSLAHLPRDIPREAEVLMLKDNHIRRLWQKPLAGMEALKHFNIKKNRIYYIEPSALVDLRELNSLNLMENRLRFLSPMTFSRQRKLQFLSIKNNRLKDIEGLFRKLPRLHLLNLGGNLIRKVTERTFKYNANLRVLDLHNNRIKYISKQAFRHLPLLKFLILRDNPLTTVDMNFKANFHLELLDFTNCRLTRMVRGLPHSIKDLRLAENAITRLEDGDFSTTRKIRLLVLTDNKIESISDGAFRKLWQLYDLHINKNRIKTLPPKLPPTLHGLYASHNRIRQLDRAAFNGTPNLEFLALKNNKIKSLDAGSFVGLKKLKSLDLSNNGLFDLHPNVFRNMKDLQVLDLSENPLDHMEQSTFDGLKNLHILQMASVSPRSNWSPVIFKEMKRLLFLDLQNSTALVRHLAENPYVLNYLQSVEDLNIIDGGLYSLPHIFPKLLPRLKSVKMVGNPWHCDRSIYWLTLWMRRGTVKFYRPKNMLCASPPQLRGKQIQELLVEELPTIPPPRKQRPDLEVVDIPIKHTYKHNITLIFNLTKDGLLKPHRASIHHNRHRSRIKLTKAKNKRPVNDVVLGDAGNVYSSGSIDPSLQDNLKTASQPRGAKDSGVNIRRPGVRRKEDVGGSGTVVVRGAFGGRVLGESSGETEQYLTL